ncbi:hypothetical protein BJ085DRAFT_11892, partial [Dimargaris cristalligena]
PHDLQRLKTQLLECPDDGIAGLVAGTTSWKYHRGDIFQWIPVLNRFDSILEQVCQDYGLYRGVQVKPFPEPTWALVCAILQFTRLLMENSINRNLYNSLNQLRALLYTCHLEVLEATLYI